MVLTQEKFIQMLRRCFEENYYICPHSKAILPKVRLADPRRKASTERAVAAMPRINN